MRFIQVICAAALATSTFATGVAADGHAAGIVKERQTHMKMYGKNLGVLGDMAKGAKDYDAAAATAAAKALAEFANKDQSGFWIEGTDTSFKGSRALPALFTNLDDIEKINTALANASNAMVDAAGTDLDALRAAIGAIGATCGECHKKYRQPK